MKIESIEPQACGLCQQDPNYPLARVWLGRLENGVQVLLYVAAVEARDLREQPLVDEALRALPALGRLVPSNAAAAFGAQDLAA